MVRCFGFGVPEVEEGTGTRTRCRKCDQMRGLLCDYSIYFFVSSPLFSCFVFKRYQQKGQDGLRSTLSVHCCVLPLFLFWSVVLIARSCPGQPVQDFQLLSSPRKFVRYVTLRRRDGSANREGWRIVALARPNFGGNNFAGGGPRGLGPEES